MLQAGTTAQARASPVSEKSGSQEPSKEALGRLCRAGLGHEEARSRVSGRAGPAWQAACGQRLWTLPESPR